MPLQFETVAIPVTKGIDLRTAARLVEPPALLEAVNARFDGQGSSKRYGHEAYRARVGSYPSNTTQVNITPYTLTPYGEKVLDTDWLYGWGVITSPNRENDTAVAGSSPYPEPGYLFGGTERDGEVVAWTGHSLISHTPSQLRTAQGSLIDSATIPVLNAQPIAKMQSVKQKNPDAADNGRVRVVVWEGTTDAGVTSVYFSVYDSVTGALIQGNTALEATTPSCPRVFSLGTWFHISIIEGDTNDLVIYSFPETDASTPVTRILADCGSYYDYCKEDETRAVFIINDATSLRTVWVGVTGAQPADESNATLVLYLGAPVTIVPLQCAIAIHPTTGLLGIAWIEGQGSETPFAVDAGTYTRDGLIAFDIFALGTVSSDFDEINQVTLAPKYQLSAEGQELWDVYICSCDTSTSTTTLTHARFRTGAEVTLAGAPIAVYHRTLASKAFRVGDRTFVWASWNSTLQSTWLLLDEHLKPVGHLDFGTADSIADTDETTFRRLASVNFTGGGMNQVVFNMALGFRVRVPSTDDQVGLFTEPSIQFVKLDFLPRLRTAQAGRCTYIAGAQVWSYDGRELTEAGFHIAPEFTLTENNDGPGEGAGSLTTLGTYSYRVDLCYRNAQNEEIRSHSLLVQTTLTGVNQAISLSIRSCPTRRDNAYLLIFRNAMIDGAPTTTWNLINSRDPTSADFLTNDQTQAFLVYNDTGAVSDAVGQDRELHPNNSVTYMMPFASPACEIIGAGKDRVWVAGGELLQGQVAPSRLFDVSEVPAWNGNLLIQVDRHDAPITGVGFLGDLGVVFRDRLTYVQEGDGPDNQANGFWPPARLALADTGALTQESIVLANVGLLFQGPAGFRLLGPGGQLAPIGEPVDTLASVFSVSSAVCVAGQSEVRWYGPTGAIVYNYLADAWSTWTCAAAAAIRTQTSASVTLITANGSFWVETPGTYRDGSSTYKHRIRFPWMHAGSLGDFQRLRRFSGIGTWDGLTEHQVHVDIYYDERDWAEEYWDWDVPDATQNTDTWGANSWGDGTWGDTASTFWARDSVWRWRRMPRKQKCSVFSIAIDDHNSDGAGFSLVALGLELAKKSGLDRTAVPGGTNVSR